MQFANDSEISLLPNHFFDNFTSIRLSFEYLFAISLQSFVRGSVNSDWSICCRSK